MRRLALLFVLACSPSQPPAPPPLASASASASANIRDASAGDASVSPRERALVAALKRDHAAIAACHRDSKHATGEMVVRVTIGVNGKVEATSVEQPSTVPRALEDCIVGRVRAARVEIAPVTIPLPFRFRTSPYDGPSVVYGNGPFEPGD